MQVNEREPIHTHIHLGLAREKNNDFGLGFELDTYNGIAIQRVDTCIDTYALVAKLVNFLLILVHRICVYEFFFSLSYFSVLDQFILHFLFRCVLVCVIFHEKNRYGIENEAKHTQKNTKSLFLFLCCPHL